jgi:hypothetical protein
MRNMFSNLPPWRPFAVRVTPHTRCLVLMPPHLALRVIVRADVHDARDPGVFQAREECTRGFLGKSYGEKFNFHAAVVLPAERVRLPGRQPFRPAICMPRQRFLRGNGTARALETRTGAADAFPSARGFPASRP